VGSLDYEIATGATATTAYLQWSTALGGSYSQLWFRAYLYIPAIPAANQRLLAFFDSGNALCASVVLVSTTGKLRMQSSAGGTITTSTTSAPAGALFRIEGYVTFSATVGQTELKIFLTPGSTTATETNTSTAVQATGNLGASIRFGQSGGNTASYGPYYFDSLGVSSAGYIGP
jgi:hypothetical protein